MKIIRTDAFIRDYKKLSRETKQRFIKQLSLFNKDIKHPSLGIKKIKGVNGIFEGRVSKSCRFTFMIDDGFTVFRKIGDHNKTLKNP